MSLRKLKGILAAVVGLVFHACATFAQPISITTIGTPYNQNFDGLTSTTGLGQPWNNGLTLPGWYLFRQPSPGTAITAYGGDNGANNTGSFYSYGSTSERSFGAVGSGGAYYGSPAVTTPAGWMAVAFTNNSGSTIGDIIIGFNGEQWREANSSAQTMVLEYGFGATFTSVSWTAPGGAFNWSSIVNSGASLPVNGNTTGLVTGVGGTINSVGWMDGDTLWIRWIVMNATGTDHGLSIDDFTFNTVNACTVPVLSELHTNVLCNGGNDASIDLTTSGGSSPFGFSWTGPGAFTASTEDISSLTAGMYSVTVTATGGCSTSTTVNITEPSSINLAITNTPVSCNGGNNGSADLTVSGGAGGYTYLWSNSAVTEDVGGLTAGGYTVTVTDANGCTASTSTTIIQPSGMSLSSSVTHVSCNGEDDGSIDLTPSGGAGGYTYDWSNGEGTQDIFFLEAGSYTVVVTDLNGCVDSAVAVVNENAAILIGSAVLNPSCASASNGAINITPVGGTGIYTFNWSNGATTEDISGLNNGIYTVTVTDGNGCSSSITLALSSPANLNLHFTWTNPNCSGANDASIDLTPLTGEAPYTYLWSNGASTQDIAGLTAGTYTVTVTDANGCMATESESVSDPGQIVSSISITTCGSYDSPSGNYTWYVSGLYADTITANNGCDSLIGIDLTIETPNTVVMTTGATLIATLPGVSYQWLNCNNMSPVPGATGQYFTPGVEGSYAVIVNDAGCFDTSSCYQTTNLALMPNDLHITSVLYPNPHTGIFNLSVSGLITNDLFVEILSIEGKTGFQQLYFASDGMINIPFDQSHLSRGLYIMRLFSGGHYKTIRFIKTE